MGQIRFNLNHGDVCMSLQLRIDSDASLMNNVDVHIHFPEGAISKVPFVYYVSTFRGKGGPQKNYVCALHEGRGRVPENFIFD